MVTELKNALCGFISRLDMAKEKTSVSLEMCQQKLPKLGRERRRRKKEQNIRKLWDKYKRCNIYEMGIPEEKKERDRRNI